MKLFLTVKKQKILIFSALLIAAVTVLFIYSIPKRNFYDGSTEKGRTEYLNKIGFSADGKSSVKDIIIPEVFGQVYTEYNGIQKRAGFDLSKFKGKNARMYTYFASEGEWEAHIIVKDGEIIGGDISRTDFGGNMLPLCKERGF